MQADSEPVIISDGTALEDFDVRPYFDGAGAVLAGTANVIMQLALAPVGYGVIESKVESGQVMRHPFKRARTTFTYLSVAMLGTDEDRDAYREAVNGSHRAVRSDAAGPVKYNAFDPALQLWVAACLYYGTVDIVERLHGPLPEAQADALYRFGARFGTTLQVRPEMWPTDRAAFAAYWDETLATLSIDEPVRQYLHALMTDRHLPRLLRSPRFTAWVTTGFLPQPFRDQMGLTWSDADQRRFDTFLRRTGAVLRRLPLPLRNVPFNVLLRDMRRRRRVGRPLV
ncbi:MAG TPA: oxygenase MpaB family protein [Jatrophihabitans sp.]|jgi:uncharacterized protein (DUF2236 family)|uniref:oxygenase MpaB family protein n=1 Tax=Jatrophihabitans sp. TaxID=1932789 RepID=UPI002DF9E7C8|nr:oxygenase MpaB family protein [Jatrophihabitans sp.]